MDDPGCSRGEALDALRAWLLTEDASERGGVDDEVVNDLQDVVSRLFGPNVHQVVGGCSRGPTGLSPSSRVTAGR